MEEKIAIVTGASSGLGESIANELIKEGYVVYNISRTKPKNKNVHHVECDLSKVSSIKNAINKIGKKYGKIDLLVNNGGMAYFGEFEKLSEKQIIEMINTNVLGYIFTTYYSLPYLKKSRRPKILNIGSYAAKNMFMYGVMYNATKFATRGFSISLFNELQKQNIPVIHINPPILSNTNFFKRSNFTHLPYLTISKEKAVEGIIKVLHSTRNISEFDLS